MGLGMGLLVALHYLRELPGGEQRRGLGILVHATRHGERGSLAEGHCLSTGAGYLFVGCAIPPVCAWWEQAGGVVDMDLTVPRLK